MGLATGLQDLTSDQRALLGCPRWGATYRIPSEPTIRRTLQQVDADEVDTILNTWLSEEALADRAIAIDGKTLRGSAHGEARPVHLLARLLHDTGQVIGQVAVDEKTNEIPKLRALLDPLEIPGAIVTVDALHTQVETARYLVDEKHAHYVMEVKQNQPTLHEAVTTLELEDFSPSGHHGR